MCYVKKYKIQTYKHSQLKQLSSNSTNQHSAQYPSKSKIMDKTHTKQHQYSEVKVSKYAVPHTCNPPSRIKDTQLTSSNHYLRANKIMWTLTINSKTLQTDTMIISPQTTTMKIMSISFQSRLSSWTSTKTSWIPIVNWMRRMMLWKWMAKRRR